MTKEQLEKKLDEYRRCVVATRGAIGTDDFQMEYYSRLGLWAEEFGRDAVDSARVYLGVNDKLAASKKEELKAFLDKALSALPEGK